MFPLSRRDFLGQSAAAVGALAVTNQLASAGTNDSKPRAASDQVVLGKSGIKTSLLGMGTGSVGVRHSPALRLERAIKDLYGLSPEGSPDTRPWLDHGRWGVRFPLGDCITALLKPAPYPFLAVEGDGMHQIPVGPVHAGIIEPGHFRFTASGETVVRLEQRLGYTHKGIERLMSSADLDRVVLLPPAFATPLHGDRRAHRDRRDRPEADPLPAS